MKNRLAIPAHRYYADALKRKNARENAYSRRVYTAVPFGEAWIFKRGNSFGDGTRYCDNISAYFREVGASHEILSSRNATRFSPLRHTAWYCDNEQEEKTYGIVLQIPARNGVPQYFAAYADPNNDNAASIDLTESYDDKESAASSADSLAERYAEYCREENAKQQAEQDIECAKEAIANIRTEHSELCAEIREATRVQFRLLESSDMPPARLTESEPSAICKALRKQLAQLRRQVTREIKTIRERRELLGV